LAQAQWLGSARPETACRFWAFTDQTRPIAITQAIRIEFRILPIFGPSTEHQNKTRTREMSQYLPSKNFIKFFGGVIALSLLIWGGSSLFAKKASYVARVDEKAGEMGENVEFYEIDTDEDGVKDWEEALWQLNPLSKDSDEDGVEDSEEVRLQREEIQRDNNIAPEESSDENLTQTEIFARQFFSTASLLNQGGQISQESVEEFGIAFGDTVKNSFIEDIYTLANLRLSGVSKPEYKKFLVAVVGPIIEKNISELSAINTFITKKDAESLAKLEEAIDGLKQMTEGFLSVKVPYGVAGIHLSIVNNAAKTVIGLSSIKKIEEDPLTAVVGLNQYIRYSGELEKNFKVLAEYLNGASGIISSI
jgi:hypothetical protein